MEIVSAVTTIFVAFVVIAALGMMAMILSIVIAQLMYGLFNDA